MASPSFDSLPLTRDARVDGLVQGHYWTFGGGAHQFTYALFSLASFGGPWTVSLQAGVEQALASWSAVADVQFSRVPASGNFNASGVDLALTLVGSALNSLALPGGQPAAVGIFPDPIWVDAGFFPGLAGLPPPYNFSRFSYPRPEGDVFINDSLALGGGKTLFSATGPGTLGLEVLIHELGHALGLKHPHDDGGNGRPNFDELGIGAQDDRYHTVMSYDGIDDPPGAGHQATPMPDDILAIQSIYGPNLAYHAGNDTYVVKADGVLRTLWDAGGDDTLDLRQITDPAYRGIALDLSSDGGWGIRTSGNSATYVAYGVRFENVLGTPGADAFTGNDADNFLDGQAGADTLSGGLGNDTYGIDDPRDVIVDDPGGTDTVRSSISLTLRADLENLVLLGASPLSGTGNPAPNALTGNDGANLLDGKGGADSLVGGKGDDVYFVTDGSAIVVEYPGGGDDRVNASVSWILGENIEQGVLQGSDPLALTGNGLPNLLAGNAGDNQISGGGGNDTLEGGGGTDTLIGGAGDDRYLAVAFGDRVVESAGEGVDTMEGVGGVIILPLNLEDLVLTGAGLGIGNGADNHLSGSSGSDTLAGGGGSDTLAGGGGDDTYLIGDGALVQEGNGAGTDTVVFDGCGNYQLGTNVENLRLPEGAGGLAGSGAGDANTLTGNGSGNWLDGGAGNDTLFGLGGDDVLIGGSGDDRLDGGRGADRMEGGPGNDTYVVGSVLDVVTEGAGNGTDTVQVHLASYVLPENVENVVGDENANTLVGNALANRLTGGGGADRFVFDRAPVSGVWDTVSDFVPGEDHLVLAGGWAGALPADFLRTGAGLTTAGAAADRLIYDTNTGSLYYDPDGTGAQAAVKIAVLEGHPGIGMADVGIA